MATSPTPSAGPPAGSLAGRLLAGRYRLERPIASGGMAEVWEATDQVLTRRVAVKLLHTHLARDDSFVRRFRAEAIASARLAHPSIVSVYDTFSEDGLEAIVMELVVGTTMRADLDQHGPLKLDAVLAIGSQVADALGAAHASGLVHRDVKPANILLSADGRVLVADFGIAKAAEGADLTSDGSVVGTAKYLAPEQVEGLPVDGRADLYSLGVVLYEALTGQAPFVADTDTGTAFARLTRLPVPPRQLRPQIPPSVEAVVMRALARRPDDRYADAAAMRAALLAAGADPGHAPAAATAAAISAEHHLRGSLAPSSGSPSGPSMTPGSRPMTTAEALSSPPTIPPPPPPPPVVRPPAPTSPPLPLASHPPSAEIHPVGPATDRQPHARPRWPWILLAVALVAGALVAAAALNDRTGGSTPAQDLALAGAAAFDPVGGDGEHDADAKFAIDGDGSTAWSTERYGTRDVNGKGGVGLIIHLDAASTLTQVAVQSPDGEWRADVYRVDGPDPADLAGWGDPVGQLDVGSAGTTTTDLESGRGRSVLIWITRLAPEKLVRISDVTVRGRS